MKVRLDVLKEYFSFLLVENRIDDAREKFPEIDEDGWQQLVANQPAGSNNKYLMWGAGQVDDGFSVEVVVQVIRLFDGNVNRLKQKDINQYKDVGAIEKAIDELPTKKTKSQEQKQARADTDKIYEDDRFLVVRPHTTEASCKYGTGTKWCIAATQTRNYYTQYSESNNKFYFVIDKKAAAGSPESKFALAIISASQGGQGAGDRIQVYNASDHLVNMNTVAGHVGEKWPEIWRKIEQHVHDNPITREVEEAAKAVEEHVAALLKGEKIGEKAMEQVASKGKLTTPVIRAIVASFEGYSGPGGYGDRRANVMSSLSDRSDQMPPEAATLVMKWIASTRPTGGGYWNGNYYLERMMRAAHLTEQGFRDLAGTGDETILANIFGNPACPDDVKQQIANQVQNFRSEESARKIYMDLIKSGKATLEQFRAAIQKDLTGRGYRYLIQDVLNNAETLNLTPEMIRLIPIQDVQQFKQLMKFRNLPSDHIGKVLTGLLKSGSMKKYDMYQAVRTIAIDTAALEQMWADNKSPELRTALLQNPGIGAGNAAKFAASQNSAYRFAVAHNSVTPVDALTTLSTDDSVSTRAAVAANPNASSEILTRLASDEATAVRASVASNEKAPRDILNALKKDGDEFVRKAVRKTLKKLEAAPAAAVAAEAYWKSMRAMLLVEALTEAMEDDSSTPDIMNPSWRDLPAGRHTLEPAEFISVFLLQNNGSATREEINHAFQSWMGSGGFKELWKTNKYSDEILRGSTAGGKGWYWSPPGINKGALFRLTPSGASAALDVLKRYREHGREPQAEVTSASAKPGKVYYTPAMREMLDITGYEKGDISVEEVEADSNNRPRKYNGKYTKISPDRSRRARWRTRSAKVYKIEMPSGEEKFVESFPKEQLPGNSAVQFLKTMFGVPAEQRKDPNLAVVRRGERFYLTEFPLWEKEGGETPARKEPNVAPPVVKSAPPRELTGEPAPARAPGAPRPTGPKVSYKIYGKKAGKTAHTRLKGQAYGAPADTQFKPGEQASLQATDDGKLKVKKVDSDHEQTWDPVEG